MTDPRLLRLSREWRQNRRLRLGALAILLILGVHATLVLADGRHVREQEYARDAALLARLDEASRESAWPQRAVTAEAALAQVRDSIPAARSDGLAQAEMQAWLTDLAAFAGLAEPSVRVETSLAVPGQDGLWQVLARLDAVVPDGAAPVLVRTLAAALPWVRTERLELQTGRDTRVSLVVRGYFRRSEGPESAQARRPADLPAAEAGAAAPKAPVRSPLAPVDGARAVGPAGRQQGQGDKPARSTRAARATGSQAQGAASAPAPQAPRPRPSRPAGRRPSP